MIGFRIATLSFVLVFGWSSVTFAAKPPVDETAARKGVEDVVRTIEANPRGDDAQIVAELRKLGYSKIQAENSTCSYRSLLPGPCSSTSASKRF